MAFCKNETPRKDVCMLKGADRVKCDAGYRAAIGQVAGKYAQTFQKPILHLTRSARAPAESQPQCRPNQPVETFGIIQHQRNRQRQRLLGTRPRAGAH